MELVLSERKPRAYMSVKFGPSLYPLKPHAINGRFLFLMWSNNNKMFNIKTVRNIIGGWHKKRAARFKITSFCFQLLCRYHFFPPHTPRHNLFLHTPPLPHSLLYTTQIPPFTFRSRNTSFYHLPPRYKLFLSALEIPVFIIYLPDTNFFSILQRPPFMVESNT